MKSPADPRDAPTLVDGRRSEERLPYSVRARFRGRTDQGSGTILNISETGLFIWTDTLVRVGESIEVDIEEPPDHVHVRGVVCWAGRRADAVSGLGVQIQRPPAGFLAIVERAKAGRGGPTDGVRRVARRIPLSMPVAVEMGNMMDTGSLVDVSLTGACLSGTRLQPAAGAQVTLCVAVEGHKRGLELHATVVRETESGGFAVQFSSMSAGLKEALMDALRVLESLPVTDDPQS